MISLHYARIYVPGKACFPWEFDYIGSCTCELFKVSCADCVFDDVIGVPNMVLRVLVIEPYALI